MKLTAKTYTKLVEELEHLSAIALPAARLSVEESKSQGDNSQNSEYFVAAQEESAVRARYTSVCDALEAHKAYRHNAARKISTGSEVILDVEGEQESYLYGAPEEMSCWSDVITPQSPLGLFLDKLEVGASGKFNKLTIKLISITDRTKA